MVSRKSTQHSSVRMQGPARTCPKVQLSKEAQAALTLRRREASHNFKKALEDAWQAVDDAAIRIATEELDAMEKERDKDIESGMIQETHWHVRSDNGKKRRQNASNETSQHHRKKTYKSMETVDSDREEDHQVDFPAWPANNLSAGSPFEDSENMPSTNRTLTPLPISDRASTPSPILDHTLTPPPISGSAKEIPANWDPVFRGTNVLHYMGPVPAPPILPGSSENLSSLLPPFNNQIENLIPMPFAHAEFNFDSILPSY